MQAKLIGGVCALSAGFWLSPAQADSPEEVHQLTAGADEGGATPFAQAVGPFQLRLTGLAKTTAYGRTDFVLDREGSEAGSDTVVLPQLRLGAQLGATGLSGTKWSVLGEVEADLATGAVATGDLPNGAGYFAEDDVGSELRKAYVRVSYGRAVHVGAGRMTSHWGLGLVANDGAHAFTPGSARFTDPRSGDRTLRGFVAVGLNERYGVVATVVADAAAYDDITLERDDARQLIGVVKVGVGQPHSGGLYVVGRDQESTDGSDLQALVVDAHAKSRFELPYGTHLGLEGEAVYITGKTTYAPSMDFAEHDVKQFAAAGRASYGLDWVGGVMDVVFASGDRNFDDDQQNAFKADPNYEQGMLMFKQVLSAQTARAVGTAGDLDLVGRPSADLDRYPTRGSISNTIAVFPRAWYRLTDGLEMYGGTLLGWTAVDSADPLNSRVAGGAAVNALDGEPGRFLGAELDVGVRYSLGFWDGVLAVGVEGAAFKPGSAFRDMNGDTMDSVYGVRSFLSYDLGGTR